MPLWVKRLLEKACNSYMKLEGAFSYSRCYDRMERAGIAIFGCCCGKRKALEAEKESEFVCLSCPYYTKIDEEE